MNRADLHKQRQKLEKELADLQASLNELNTSGEDIQLAEGLHDLQCNMNHTDMCDWEYGDWKDSVLRGSRKSYLEQAQRIFDELSDEWGLQLSVDQVLKLAKVFR